MRRRKFFLFLLFIATLPMPAGAEDHAKGFLVAARALGFILGIGSEVKVAIIYDPSNANSVSAKNAILARAGTGIRIGQTFLTAIPVEASTLSTAPDIGALYLTPGLSAYYESAK